MNAKHTPGPFYRAGNLICANTPKGQAEIAQVYVDSEYVLKMEAEANMALFLAAPGLLWAAESLIEHYANLGRKHNFFMDNLAKEVAKAKGEPGQPDTAISKGG